MLQIAVRNRIVVNVSRSHASAKCKSGLRNQRKASEVRFYDLDRECNKTFPPRAVAENRAHARPGPARRAAIECGLVISKRGDGVL